VLRKIDEPVWARLQTKLKLCDAIFKQTAESTARCLTETARTPEANTFES
jgi:hypothetical protein